MNQKTICDAIAAADKAHAAEVRQRRELAAQNEGKRQLNFVRGRLLQEEGKIIRRQQRRFAGGRHAIVE